MACSAIWCGCCVDVRHRVTRSAAILVSLCLTAWAIFLLFGAPREWPQPSQRSDGSFDFFHDLPVVVAGREVGVFGSANAADRLLGLLAFPAIHFASYVVGLTTFTIGDPTVAQSCVVAGIAAILSCAWWLACGNAVSAVPPPSPRSGGSASRPRRRDRDHRRPAQARASNTRLNGDCTARRNVVKPAPCTTARSRASPAWAPSASPTSCASEHGVQISVDAA